jgi:hypothetical protein
MQQKKTRDGFKKKRKLHAKPFIDNCRVSKKTCFSSGKSR